jgi:hypothetical protein
MARIPKLVLTMVLLAVPFSVASAKDPAHRHPDGNSVTYRGWGPATRTADGYDCVLYGPAGNRIGTIHFLDQGGVVDLYLEGREAHFLAGPIAFLDFHPLDPVVFPDLADVPAQYKASGNLIMLTTGRGEVGVNMHITDPVTPLARKIATIEVHCTYIADPAGRAIFCLNCVFVVSPRHGQLG